MAKAVPNSKLNLKALQTGFPAFSADPLSSFFAHVYSYFGTFLGCSELGGDVLPAYAGQASMYEVHK
jgi:hypothetical protein